MTHPQALPAESVDWLAPIEARRAGGDWQPAKVEDAVREDLNSVGVPLADGSYHHLGLNGSPFDSPSDPPIVRNVAPQPETVPVDNVVLAQAVVAQIVALLDRICGQDAAAFIGEVRDEARELHKLLSPVDPDLIVAREIASGVLMRLGASAEQIAAGDIKAGDRDDAIVVHVALAALKRARTHPAESGTTSAGER